MWRGGGRGGAALVGIIALFGAAAALGDDARSGTVAGRVRVSRVPPREPPRPIARQQEVCGREARDESVVVGTNGALAGAVVSLEGLSRPAALPPSMVRLDLQGCRFVPHVLSATTGATLELTSRDPVLHTAHAVLGSRRTLFNVAIPRVGLTIRRRLSVAGRVRFRCDVGHPWMSALLVVFDHPYHAVTGADGSFRIDDVPAGEHTLHVAHDRLGERRLRVRVPAAGRADVAIDL